MSRVSRRLGALCQATPSVQIAVNRAGRAWRALGKLPTQLKEKMTWSGTWPGPPAENHVRTDAKLAEPGSCLENRASFAISLARCEAETAAMPSPWGLLSPIFTAFSASTALAWGVSTTSSSPEQRRGGHDERRRGQGLACGPGGASSVGAATTSDSLAGPGDSDSLAEPGNSGEPPGWLVVLVMPAPRGQRR